MSKKKKMHPIIKIILLLFVVYIALFIANASGYYQNRIRDKVYTTDKDIKVFEEKIKNGEVIDLNSYIKKDSIKYDSKMSMLGDKVTNAFEGIVSSSAEFLTDLFKHLF